jgi:hypothetical protein
VVHSSVAKSTSISTVGKALGKVAACSVIDPRYTAVGIEVSDTAFGCIDKRVKDVDEMISNDPS